MANATEELRVVLIGKTGNGKSATGNSLVLSRAAFKISCSPNSITKCCTIVSQNYENINGKRINLKVVDTPGFFDSDQTNTNERIKTKIGSEIFEMTSPGVHAFLIVVTASRFSPEEAQTIKLIQDMFGNDAHKYCLMVITKKDELVDNDRSPIEFINESPGLAQLYKDCSRRFFAINNKLDGEKSRKQSEELVKLIHQMVKDNGGQCYTNEKYKQIEQQRQEAERRRQEAELAKQKQEQEKREAEKRALIEKTRQEEREKAQQREREIREEERRNVERSSYSDGNSFMGFMHNLSLAFQENSLEDRMPVPTFNSCQPSASSFRGSSAHGGRFTGEYMSTNGSANGRAIYEGSGGGQYYLTSGGNKQYLRKK